MHFLGIWSMVFIYILCMVVYESMGIKNTHMPLSILFFIAGSGNLFCIFLFSHSLYPNLENIFDVYNECLCHSQVWEFYFTYLLNNLSTIYKKKPFLDIFSMIFTYILIICFCQYLTFSKICESVGKYSKQYLLLSYPCRDKISYFIPKL